METAATLLTVLVLLLGHAVGCIPRPASFYYSKEQIAAYTEASQRSCGDGMIIAIGGCFGTEIRFSPLAKRAIAHTGKQNPNALYLPTAHFDDPNDSADSAEEMVWLKNKGCNTDTLYVSREDADAIREKIEWADIVYASGGNLRELATQWADKGVNELLRAAFDRGAVLMGYSSGAMCWADVGRDDCGEPTRRITGDFPFFYGEGNAYEYYDCVGIMPFTVTPHFESIGWRAFALDAMKMDTPSIGIEGGAALVYEHGNYSVISDPGLAWRTAFLFDPANKLYMIDLKTNGRLAVMAQGEALINRQ